MALICFIFATPLRCNGSFFKRGDCPLVVLQKIRILIPMLRGNRFFFDFRPAWRSFFSKKSVHMQRAAQSAQRDFGASALPRYVFQYLGLRRFLRVACFVAFVVCCAVVLCVLCRCCVVRVACFVAFAVCCVVVHGVLSVVCHVWCVVCCVLSVVCVA